MKKIIIYGLSEELGGVETIILSIVNRLSNRFSFTIVLSNKDNCSYFNRIPVGVNLVNVTSWGSNPRKFKEEFCEILNDYHSDLVWLNACVTSNRAIIQAIKSANSNVKLITHSHGTNYENDGVLKTFIIKTLHRINRKVYNRTASLKLACSHRAAEWFYGKDKCSDVTILNNGIDTSVFAFDGGARKRLRHDYGCEDSFVCLHIGRLAPVKNQSYLLKIFAEISKINSNSKLIIAGTGELESELKHQAAELGIKDKVLFLGQYGEVSELYNMSDAFLLPSLHEGMPLTLVEAQCAGLHCFVSSTVSSEVQLTRFLSFEYITESPYIWAQHILLHNYEVNRDLGRVEIIQSGFDIDSICLELAEKIDSI